MTFLWSNKFIDQIIVDAQDNKPGFRNEISFKYEGNHIKTTDSLVFLYQSYKFLIIRDLKSKKNKLYENKNITFLETKKVKN